MLVIMLTVIICNICIVFTLILIFNINAIGRWIFMQIYIHAKRNWIQQENCFLD